MPSFAFVAFKWNLVQLLLQHIVSLALLPNVTVNVGPSVVTVRSWTASGHQQWLLLPSNANSFDDIIWNGEAICPCVEPLSQSYKWKTSDNWPRSACSLTIHLLSWLAVVYSDRLGYFLTLLVILVGGNLSFVLTDGTVEPFFTLAWITSSTLWSGARKRPFPPIDETTVGGRP